MNSRFAGLILEAALLVIAVSVRITANDSAASTAAGGLQLTRVPRISMQKERLIINEKEVRVEYDFLNESDHDIQTEVAFPIPDYEFEGDPVAGSRSFDDFQLWVEGKTHPYKTDISANAGGVDCSAILRKAGVDIASFGHFDWNNMMSPDIVRLSASQRS